MKSDVSIVPYHDARRREEVVRLWRSVFGYETKDNEPGLTIDKKEAVADGLFFVAESEVVMGAVMCGYDGHRGWIYSLAVSPDHRRKGVGRELMRHAERALAGRGCLKINLQIMVRNQQVEAFYQKLGYSTEPRINMGKTIPENVVG